MLRWDNVARPSSKSPVRPSTPCGISVLAREDENYLRAISLWARITELLVKIPTYFAAI